MGRWPNLNQKNFIFSKLDYEPTPEQRAIHDATDEVIQILGAEGGGKSFVTAMEITSLLPFCKLVYLVGEKYENTIPEFDYLKKNLTRLGLLDSASRNDEGKGKIFTMTGCEIRTISARVGASSIIAKGQSPDLIVLCEAGVIQSYSVATAAIRRVTRARGRCILVGTLRDNFGWYAGLVDELSAEGNAWRGRVFSLPAWSNIHIYKGGRNDPEILRLEQILDADEFARTVAAEKVPSRALIFPEMRWSTHARPCPFDPDLDVHIWIDPGYYPSSYVVLPVQFHGDEVWMVDEIYENFKTHKEVIRIAKARPWWNNVTRGVIDIAGRQHHAEDSAVEVWKHQAHLTLHSQKVSIKDGIDRHRDFLRDEVTGRARLFHDSERCLNTLREYGQYKRPTDKDGNVTSDEPKDEHNHSMKAIAYGLIDRYGRVDKKRKMEAAVIRRKQQPRRGAARWN